METRMRRVFRPASKRHQDLLRASAFSSKTIAVPGRWSCIEDFSFCGSVRPGPLHVGLHNASKTPAKVGKCYRASVQSSFFPAGLIEG